MYASLGWHSVEELVAKVAGRVLDLPGVRFPRLVVGVEGSGVIPAVMLAYRLGVPHASIGWDSARPVGGGPAVVFPSPRCAPTRLPDGPVVVVEDLTVTGRLASLSASWLRRETSEPVVTAALLAAGEYEPDVIGERVSAEVARVLTVRMPWQVHRGVAA